LGDILVVTITGDDYILKKKKTFFNQNMRLKQAASVEIVDFSALIFESTALTAIEYLKPDFYVKGGEFKNLTSDPTSNIIKEKELVESNGGKIYFTNGATFSSTKIGYFLGTSSEADQGKPFVKRNSPSFRDISTLKFELNEINSFLKKLSELNVCVIGETIVDEVVSVKLRSISQKSKCISGEEQKKTTQKGGAGIVALHLSNFVKSVDFYTNYMELDFGKPNLHVKPLCNGRIIKTRHIDAESNNVIYEHKVLDPLQSDLDYINEYDKYDIVIVADFGHGLIDMKDSIVLSKMKNQFLAVMAQSNSSNFGFNIIDKYPFADFFSMNKLEAELLLRKNYQDNYQLIDELSETLKSKYIAVTLSKEGALIKNYSNPYLIPSLSESVIDTVGCGDAFLAFAAPALALGFEAKYAGLFGNIGSAVMAQRVMNENAVTYQEFLTVAKIVI
jgi:bifunctional ADP-heptose synthase (sugar kinase/adenylyltransferase)